MSRHARKCVVRCMSGRVDGRTGLFHESAYEYDE